MPPDLSRYTKPLEHYIAIYEEQQRFFRSPPPVDPQNAEDLKRFDALCAMQYSNRVNATWGMIAKGKASIRYALQMLKSADPDAREDAGGILHALGRTAEVVEELITALENESTLQAEDSIIIALGAMRTKAAIPVLAKLLRRSDVDGDTAWTAAEALGRIVRRRFAKETDARKAAQSWLDRHGY